MCYLNKLTHTHSVHSYGGHCNAATKVRLGKAMVPLGFAMVQPDLPGHGYSEGERAYVERYSHWLDDIVQVRLAASARVGALQRKMQL